MDTGSNPLSQDGNSHLWFSALTTALSCLLLVRYDLLLTWTVSPQGRGPVLLSVFPRVCPRSWYGVGLLVNVPPLPSPFFSAMR